MAEIFTRKFSEVSGGRFDPEFYIGQTIQIVTYPLKNFVKIKSGKRIPKGRSYANTTTAYKYLRVDDLDSEILEIDIDKLKSIDKDIFTLLERYEIYNDEVALSIAGTIGKVFIFHNATNNRVILTENCVKLQAQDNLLPKFLSLILKTNFLQSQMKRQYIQTTIPKLAIERIKELQIPSIPPLSTQQHIIDLMDKAYKAKQEKENKAKELLDSIDSYLLEELGIILPLRSNSTLDSRIYTQKISALSGSRFDANYHQPYYKKFEQALESGKYKTLRLVDICQFRRGSFPQPYGNQEWYGGANAMPFVQVADIDDNFKLKEKTNQQISQLAQPKSVFVSQNTIILSIQGTIGRVAITQYDCYVDRTIAIFTELSNLLNQHFLAYMLSILFKNKADTARGITLKTITKEEFRNFKIPLPPLTEQERIAKEISQRKAQAKALKQEAKESLESAKKEVEHIILGG